MRLSFIFCGFLLLFTGSYLDNIRGPLLPVLTRSLQLSYTDSSWFLIAGNIGSVIATFLLIPLTHFFSERSVTIGMIVFGIFSVFLANLVVSFSTMVFFAVFIGSTVSVFGAMANVFVVEGSTSQARSKIFCMLHMMYGIGSLVAPLCVGLFLNRGASWHTPILALLPVLALCAILVLVFIPRRDPTKETAKQPMKLSLFQCFIVATFCIYVVGEVLLSMWMVTYLVEYKKMTVISASPYLTGFFLVVAVTRGLCLFSFKPKYEKNLLLVCLISAVCFFYLGIRGWFWGFSLAGVLGPYFPVFLARVSKNFPTQWRPLTLWILGSMQLCLALSHILIGKVTDLLGVGQAYFIPGFFLLLALVTSFLYFYVERKVLKIA